MFVIRSLASDAPGYVANTISNGSYTKDFAKARVYRSRADAEKAVVRGEEIVPLNTFVVRVARVVSGHVVTSARIEVRATSATEAEALALLHTPSANFANATAA